MSAYCAGGLPIESWHPTSPTCRSAGVAPEVNLTHPLWAAEEACKQEIHTGFETQGIPHQKSKTGVSVAPQKELMFSKELKKRKEIGFIHFPEFIRKKYFEFQISFL